MPTGAAAPPCRCHGCAGDRRVISSACALPVRFGVIQLEAFAAATVFLLRIVRVGGHGCASLPLPWLRWGRRDVWTRAARCLCRGGDPAGSVCGSYGLLAPHCPRGRPRLHLLAAALAALGAAGAAGTSGRGLRGLCCWGDPAGSVCGSYGLLAPHCPGGGHGCASLEVPCLGWLRWGRRDVGTRAARPVLLG